MTNSQTIAKKSSRTPAVVLLAVGFAIATLLTFNLVTSLIGGFSIYVVVAFGGIYFVSKKDYDSDEKKQIFAGALFFGTVITVAVAFLWNMAFATNQDILYYMGGIDRQLIGDPTFMERFGFSLMTGSLVGWVSLSASFFATLVAWVFWLLAKLRL